MENRTSVDQRRAKVERFFAEHHDEVCRQGSVVTTYRRRSGQRLGPYFRLTCRVGARQVAVYLGADENLARSVRERLSQLQWARTTDKRIAKVRRVLRQQARLARKIVDVELALLGLHRQGNEIRGWRSIDNGKAAESLNSLSTMLDYTASISEHSDLHGGNTWQ